MVIPFYKCNANNNKFVVIIDSEIPEDFKLNIKNVKYICYNFADEIVDGLIILNIKPNIEMNYYNNDGTWETFCLNGLRCCAQIINKITSKKQIDIFCNKKQYSCDILNDNNVKVTLDEPTYKIKNIHIENLLGNYIDSGAKHFVVECLDKLPNDNDAYKIARKIRYNKKLFPSGINVNFYSILKDNTISIITYEKGIEAIMQSCASGSYACMYQYANKYNFYKDITLKNKCGKLIGNFNPNTKIGSIIGNAEITYKKEYKYE